jgi:hypothetical protein
MTIERIDSVETRLASDARAGPEVPADPADLERDYANDYATYWQARSGFFDRAPDGNRNH